MMGCFRLGRLFSVRGRTFVFKTIYGPSALGFALWLCKSLWFAVWKFLRMTLRHVGSGSSGYFWDFIGSFSILILFKKTNAFTEIMIIWTSARSPQRSPFSFRDLVRSLPAVLISHQLLSSPSVLKQVSFWTNENGKDKKKSRRILWPPILMSFIESEILFARTGAESQRWA